MKSFYTETIVWVNNEVARPIKSGRHLTRHYHTIVDTETCYEEYLNYSKRHDAWNAQDDQDEPRNEMEVTYWAYIETEEGGEK